MHSARIPSYDDVLQAFRRAGLASLTPLQERMIPHILKGRDVVVETSPGAGATTGFMVPLVLSLRGAGDLPRAVILAADAQDLGKKSRAHARLARVVRDAPSFFALGETEDARKEQRRLEKGAVIIAGTVARVIDHIRRGSLLFDELATIVVTEPGPEAMADFVKDVQFIFAKFTERPQVILLARSRPSEEDEMLKLLHHPALVGAEELSASAVKSEHLAFACHGGNRVDLLARILIGKRLPDALVFHAPRTDARRLADALRARGLRVAALFSGPGNGRQQPDRRATLLALTRRTLDVVLVPHGSAVSSADFEELIPTHVVYLDLPAGAQRAGVGRRIKGTSVLALVDDGQEKDLARLQEAIGVSFTKGEIPNDDEVLSGAIDRAVRRMKEEDQSELALLRRQIRRQVPLFLRPLFMASLLKSQLQGLSTGQKPRPAAAPAQPAPSPAAVPPRGQRGRFGKADMEARPARPPEAAKPSPRADARREGAYTQLFVSIGRNRRVYARDLADLFKEKLQLSEGDIGGVRVFDKYSFVDIAPSKAEEAISRLTGVEVKGRAITVNFAKKKEEKEAK